MLKYDLYTVQKFLHGLSVLTKTNVSLYDKDFTPLPRALYPFTEKNGGNVLYAGKNGIYR